MPFLTNYIYTSSVGISIDPTKMDLSLEDLRAEFPKVSSELESLEKGDPVNKDEGRMVGHYWLRAPDLAPSPEVSLQIKEEIESTKRLYEDLASNKINSDGERFKHLVIIGIGGSALGPQLLDEAFSSPTDPFKLWFCDNTDPDGVKRIARHLGDELPRTLFAVVSKSGGTVETRNGMLEFKHICNKKKLSFEKRAIAVTTPGSKLAKIAEENSWAKTLYLFDWVGGRTSLWSPVGLLPLALLGRNPDDLLRGAAKMDEATREEDFSKNPAAILAACWLKDKDKAMVVLPYSDRLSLLGKYLQQLVMESLGKQHNRDGNEVFEGQTVYGNKGSTDQHAYVQQLREGPENFFTCFVQCLSVDTALSPKTKALQVEADITSLDYLQGFLLGTKKALYENGRSSFTITIDKLSVESLGALLALFERAVSFYASFRNINAYHQPGVEAGKKAAGKAIELQKKILSSLSNTPQTCQELEAASEDGFYILKYLAVSESHGVKFEGSWEDPEGVKFWRETVASS